MCLPPPRTNEPKRPIRMPTRCCTRHCRSRSTWPRRTPRWKRSSRGCHHRRPASRRLVNSYRLACIPGDGIGPQVIASGLEIIRRAGEITGRFTIRTTDLPWSCAYYLEHGVMMPPDGLRILADHDAIYLGAVGFPTVPDHVSLRGLLLPIRQGFDQYVNLRPVRVLEGIPSPLREGTSMTVDMLCIRENTEGEYAGIGGPV